MAPPSRRCRHRRDACSTEVSQRALIREKVADVSLADKLHRSTQTALTKTDARVREMPHWRRLRDQARQIKLHTLTHLDQYLQQFITAAEGRGAVVLWADTGAEACEHVIEIARRRGVTRVCKAKSMTSEEIRLNRALERAGIEPVETDFGEMICQLAGRPPSHVTAPMIEWSIEEVARLLRDEGVIDSIPDSLRGPAADQAARVTAAAQLVAAARRRLREKFWTAGLGVSGANFAVAESGTLVLIENEANLRLSTTLPKIHVAIVGIDKFIPRLADLGTFLSLLPVAATGQRQTAYVTLLHRPFDELHIILLDNGRSRVLADRQHTDLLSCIRCGACMNACPVYRHISGHGYNSVYPGPIGAVLMPHLRPGDHYGQLPFASSLCGACADICPVGIPLPERLLQWRERIVSRDRRQAEALTFRAWAWLMQHPAVYRAARPPADWMDAVTGVLPPGRHWKATRDLPGFADETFADWWRKNRAPTED